VPHNSVTNDDVKNYTAKFFLMVEIENTPEMDAQIKEIF